MNNNISGGTAHLVLDKPLVREKIDLIIPAVGSYRELFFQYITDPGVAFIPIVNGEVVDLDGKIQAGDEIRSVAQIVGG